MYSFMLAFQTQHSDVDIDHYLVGCNPIFRKFIDDGLAELERAATENNHGDNKVLSENRFCMSKTIGKDPDYWMDRLNALKVSKILYFCKISILLNKQESFSWKILHSLNLQIKKIFSFIIQKNARGVDQHGDNRSSTENLNVNLLAQKSLITQKEVSHRLNVANLKIC